MAEQSKDPWGDKPIKDMTQKEFEAKHRELQAKASKTKK